MSDDKIVSEEEGKKKNRVLKDEKDKTWDDEDWEDSSAIGVGC